MEQDITFKIIFLCVLLLLSGFFSGSEASLFSLTELHLHKMKEDKNPFYLYVSRLLAYPRRLLTTVLIGNESVNITISALATSIFISSIGIEEGKWVSIGVTTLALLVFGEAIPKTFAVNYPIRFSNSVSIPLTFFAAIERPVVWILEKISDLFVHVFGRVIVAESTALTEDEFKTLVDAGHEEGALEESQKDLIHRVFKLADTTVSDIMTPRVDMFCLPLSMNVEQMVQEVLKARYSRIPIYRTDKDDILGVLHARHLLEISKGLTEGSVRHLLKKPFFVPLERSIESMLKDFKGRRIQMAFVVDEYGGIEGLVTINDIMESLVGDIYDEDDIQEKPYQKINDGSYMLSGAMDIEEFNELVGTFVSLEEFDTVGGFVFHLFGKLPARGDTIDFNDYTMKVEKVSKTRIMKVRLKKKEELTNE